MYIKKVTATILALVSSFSTLCAATAANDPAALNYQELSREVLEEAFQNQTLELLEVDLRAMRPFDNFLKYTGYGKVSTSTATPFKKPTADRVIKRDSIINLTSSLASDGTLNAKLPEGKWTILRFGQTSTAARNKPASYWGEGLECDKFSRAAYKTHFDAFCQRVIGESQAVAPNALQ